MKNQMTALSIYGLDEGFKKKLSKIARQKGVTVSTLSRIWLTEKLNSIES